MLFVNNGDCYCRVSVDSYRYLSGIYWLPSLLLAIKLYFLYSLLLPFLCVCSKFPINTCFHFTLLNDNKSQMDYK
ncbi:hypothetical protein BSCG_04556 [Bacteroides sp. 2_2_4]|nr:hypothetical protein BSCG_04556 [Bacteroides sp. 2_2_4]